MMDMMAKPARPALCRARRTLKSKAEALAYLATNLPADFTTAVDKTLQTTSRPISILYMHDLLSVGASDPARKIRL